MVDDASVKSRITTECLADEVRSENQNLDGTYIKISCYQIF